VICTWARGWSPVTSTLLWTHLIRVVDAFTVPCWIGS
jgi:hypothetical protein